MLLPYGHYNGLIIGVDRPSVELHATDEILKVLQSLYATPERVCEFFDQMSIIFDGYDDDERELFEIPEVVRFVRDLDSAFPYWAFFLSRKHRSMRLIARCIFAELSGNNYKDALTGDRMLQELITRWFPAMNKMASLGGFSMEQIRDRTGDVIEHLYGVRPPDYLWQEDSV